MKMKMLKSALLGALFFSALPAQADVYWVTNTDGGKTPGSFAQVMDDMRYAEDDTLMFADDLADKTITVTLHAINRGAKIHKRTFIGNGVKLATSGSGGPGQISFGYSTSEYLDSLIVENMDFDAKVTLNGVNTRTTNCVFRAEEHDRVVTVEAQAQGESLPIKHTLIFEGCAFLGKADGGKTLRINSKIRPANCEADLRFVSCTFVNNAATPFPNATGNILYRNENAPGPNEEGRAVSFTNCVLTDAAASPEYPSARLNTFTSNGYNVIRGKITTATTAQDGAEPGWAIQATDDVAESILPGAPAPLIYDEGIYKVNTQGPAYQRLPANTSIEGIHFPVKDLAGTAIDYTKETHSGAYQATIQGEVDDYVPATGVHLNITEPQELYVGDSLQLQAIVEPPEASNRGVGWTSSSPAVAEVTDGWVKAKSQGVATIKATTVDGGYEASLTVAVFNFVPVPVSSIGIDRHTAALDLYETLQLNAEVLPANATAKEYGWTSDNEAVATVSADGLVTPLSYGTANITVTTTEGNFRDTCTVTVEQLRYTDGVFFVNEDWFGHRNSSLNFLKSDGTWVYEAYRKVNPGRELGCTSQYGAIYGGRLFIVSKQARDGGATVDGSRLAVADAETLESQAETAVIAQDENGKSIADGRAFLGVDENKGYISTSNGIWIYDIANEVITGQVSESGSTSGLYSGQIGSMLRVGDRVFAVKQSTGILVIDALTHTVETTLTGRNYFSLTLDNEGNIWSCFSEKASGSLGDDGASNMIIKIDPYTLDTIEITLPEGFYGPASTWAAWQLAPIHASKQDGKLYWVAGVGSWSGKQIIAYDTKTNTAEIVFDLATYDSDNWHAYGGGFGVHPVTNDLYLPVQKGAISSNVWNTLRIDPATKQIAEEYPMKNNWWYVAMPVFPDNAAPVVSDFEDIAVTDLQPFVIPLAGVATDADNLDAAIIKSVLTGYNGEVVSPRIWHDSLYITPLAYGESVVSIRFNSNGKTVDKTVSIALNDTEAPSQPNILTDSATETSIILTWNASTDNVAVTGYTLYLDGDSISTVTGTEYTFTGLTANTEYRLEVDAVDAAGNRSGKASLTQRTLNPTGIPGVDESITAVYPNPFTDYIIIDAAAKEDIVIYDLSGKAVFSASVKPGSNRIDVSDLPKGVYLLKLETKTIKIVK